VREEAHARDHRQVPPDVDGRRERPGHAPRLGARHPLDETRAGVVPERDRRVRRGRKTDDDRGSGQAAGVPKGLGERAVLRGQADARSRRELVRAKPVAPRELLAATF
jgi:hypothetical protein